MEPVINPWVFYLIDVADCLKWGALIFGASFAVALLAVGFWGMGDAINDEEEKIAKKRIKTGIIIGVASAVVFIIVPSSDTVMKMVIAKNVTYDAVDAAKDVVVQVYNDILALFAK